MRCSLVSMAVLAPLWWLSACTSHEQGPPPGPVQQPVREPVPEPAGDAVLRINEVRVPGTGDRTSSSFEGTLEIYNVGDSPADLSLYSLRTDLVDDWRLPNVSLQPGAMYVIRSLEALGGSFTGFSRGPIRSVSLMDRLGHEVDRLEIPASLANGVLGRYPDGIGSPYVYPLDRSTFGFPNGDIGFVRNLAAGTEFKRRDSSTNAIVTYGGYHWILGGWSNFDGVDDWHSYTDVWRSSDAVRWALVNEQPPYIHYSSFVEWRGRMWVIGIESFSSEDGIDWRPEPIEAPVLNRTVVFHDSLLTIYGSTVVMSEDGQRWTTLTDTAPWGNRVQPTVVVYKDKIWVMGGDGGYYTDNDEVFNEAYFNDVWSSADGVTWELVNPNADWSPRLWSSGAVYDDKIFVINGFSLTEWPDEWGNTAEIWFTEDGVDWFPLESEIRWAPRHASLTTIDEKNGLLLLAGYGGGNEVERSYNDVWSVHVAVFFSKPEGDLRDLATWGKRKDGSGASPESFDAPDQVFVLRNRPSFEIDESFAVRGAGSRIFVGDGQRTHSVELNIVNGAQPHQPLYLLSNSTTTVNGCSPTVYFKHQQAVLIAESAKQCDKSATTRTR